MGKRRAKRQACAIVAALIRSYQGNGQPDDDCFDEVLGWTYEDAEPLNDALDELAEELDRRAGDAQPYTW